MFGLPAIKMVYTSKINNSHFKVMTVATMLNNTLYSFDYTSSVGIFDEYLPKVMHMIESFKIGLK